MFPNPLGWEAGCIARRMQRDFHHGLPGFGLSALGDPPDFPHPSRFARPMETVTSVLSSVASVVELLSACPTVLTVLALPDVPAPFYFLSL